MARIWLVDDQRQWLELYKAALTDEGHEVGVFEDGREALADLEAGNRPDVVVLDVQMIPCGAEVLRGIRRKCPDLPVIMNTSCSGCRERAEFSAATGFVVKDTNPAPLLNVISQALTGSKGS